MSANAINNSYQIKEEFNFSSLRRTFYRPKKHHYKSKRERNGKIKEYSEEEIFLYMMRLFSGKLVLTR